MIQLYGKPVGWWLIPPLVLMILMALAYAVGEYQAVKPLGLVGCLPFGLLPAVVFRAAGIELPWHEPGGEWIIPVMVIVNWYILSCAFHWLYVLVHMGWKWSIR